MTQTLQLTGSIVLYHNEPDLVRRALSSFTNTTLTSRLYLIDNSDRAELRAVADEFEGVEYRAVTKNLGYGAAHNIVLRNCLGTAPYHLVMNPDIWFEPGQLELLFAYMEDHTDVGLVMPLIKLPDGQIQFLCKLLPTPFDLVLRRFLPDLPCFRPRRHTFELRSSGYDHEMEVPYLSGCFMFLRTAVLMHVGLFDERFFLYCEDTDLSRRIQSISRTMFYPHAQVYHQYGQGSYRQWSLLGHHLASARLYFNKWGWFHDPERERINRTILARL